MKEGWKNDFQTAMKEVDHELIEEVVKGEHENVGWFSTVQFWYRFIFSVCVCSHF